MFGYDKLGIPVLIIGLLGAIVFGIAVGLVNGVIIAKYHGRPRRLFPKARISD